MLNDLELLEYVITLVVVLFLLFIKVTGFVPEVMGNVMKKGCNEVLTPLITILSKI